jgi:hypothetical protein
VYERQSLLATGRFCPAPGDVITTLLNLRSDIAARNSLFCMQKICLPRPAPPAIVPAANLVQRNNGRAMPCRQAQHASTGAGVLEFLESRAPWARW